MWSPGEWRSLQRLIGNQAVAQQVTAQRKKTRKGPAPAKSGAQVVAEHVERDVSAGNFAGQEQHMAPGQYGPPAPGGAYWRLNGLNPTDLVTVLGHCSRNVRKQLIEHIAEADGKFDRPRLESAMRSVAWDDSKTGIAGLELLDIIRTAGTGSFSSVWTALRGSSRVSLIARLRTLDRVTLGVLLSRLDEAPVDQRTIIDEVVTDLLGAGTSMEALDVIDLKPLRGVQRRMARIYNLRGQFIHEQATALGISTHAAAGVMQAESGGGTFSDRTDKAIIRFENHVFWDRWGKSNKVDFRNHFRYSSGKRWQGHEFRDDPKGQWRTFHGDQEAEWRVMTFAAGLSDDETAYQCASWGAGQIMGFNATTVGFASAVDMAASYNVSERSQMAGIFEFIRANSLAGAINAGDYLTLAKRYNGTGKAAEYEKVIRTYADAYKFVTTGKTHCIP
jgi:hypothetical protein